MKCNKFVWMLLLLAVVGFTACEHEDVERHHFGNKFYLTSTPIDDDLLIKTGVESATRSVTSRLAMPADRDFTVTFEAHPEWAAQYNLIYNDNAFALPAEHFEIPEKKISVRKGDISGEDLVINFLNTDKLNASLRYVLPVTIEDADGMSILDSRRTVYFVFKGAAAINVVADITKIYFPINWSDAAKQIVSNMPTVTVECLLRSGDWVAKRDNPLSTVFGIEDSFLIRIGDGDRPRDQLQLVEPNGNKWPAPNAAPGLPVNEWVHIAVVWDATTGEKLYYQNGALVASSLSGTSGSANLNSSSCYIGKAYDSTRWLPGEVSEMRVWSVQRTAEEIASHMYFVDPSTPGLVAYWKFNEGDGSLIKDHSGNGTDITGSGTPKWVPVELPPIE